MIRQTLAIFLDAYRELNARKLFWITMILSGLVVAIFAMIGINEKGLRVLVWDIESPFNTSLMSAEYFYKSMFTDLGIKFWLSWIAAILALVSTASIIPDFISGGAIDLVLSKPISRLRLFLTKYLTGLFFVALQVGVFCTASFFVLGLRADAWMPAIFLAIPLVVLFFSYLFSICALLGLLTRSTIASLLLTILIWSMIFVINAGESGTLYLRLNAEERLAALDRDIERREAEIVRLEARDTSADTAVSGLSNTARLAALREAIERRKEQRIDTAGTADTLRTIHRLIYATKFALPKTGETVNLTTRYLVSLNDLPLEESARKNIELPQSDTPGAVRVDDERMAYLLEEEMRSRSELWIIGTSLGFEFILLAIACVIFIRRDF